MRINEFLTEKVKQRLDPKCWKGKHKEGTKIKGGVRVNNCVPNESVEEASNPAQQAAIAISKKKAKGVAEGLAPGQASWKKEMIAKGAVKFWRDQHGGGAVDRIVAYDKDGKVVGGFNRKGVAEGENWSKHNNPRAGGMSKKSVASYRRSHPGSKIQTAVTTKPSKLKKGSKSAKRRKSFCARMRGMKKHRTGAKTARDPNSNINKSLRRWHCESIEELQQLVMLAEQFIKNNRKV